jgi:hypothetical protein
MALDLRKQVSQTFRHRSVSWLIELGFIKVEGSIIPRDGDVFDEDLSGRLKNPSNVEVGEVN